MRLVLRASLAVSLHREALGGQQAASLWIGQLAEAQEGEKARPGPGLAGGGEPSWGPASTELKVLVC